MEYNYLDNTLLIEGSKGYVYQNNKLMFQGNSYFAIVLYIKNTDYNENVKNIFKSQLTMREKCRLKTIEKERMNPGVDHEQQVYTTRATKERPNQKRKRKGYDTTRLVH